MKVLLVMLIAMICISFISAEVLDQKQIYANGLTIELASDVQWLQEGNSYTPIYKDEKMYELDKDGNKVLVPLTEITFRVNMLEDTKCIDMYWEKSCVTKKWDFSKFESKNIIDKKEVTAVYSNEKDTWYLQLWENFLELFGKDTGARLIGYDIKYTGTIKDLDPALTVTYSTSSSGFFNNTISTLQGLHLVRNSSDFYTNNSAPAGDYRSFVYYNQSAMNWTITLGQSVMNITNGTVTNANANVTLQFRTASSYNISDPSLVAFWSFNTDNSSTAIDETGKNNGTRNGGIMDARESNGVVGKGYGFDGVDDYVDAGQPASLNLGTHDLTIVVWIKLNNVATASQNIVSKRDTSYGKGYTFAIVTAAGHFKLLNATAVLQIDYPSSSFIANTWYQVVAVVNRSDKVYLYKNGVNVASGSSLVGTNWATEDLTQALNFNIGAQANSAVYFNGSIDEVRIYNRSLSASEVLDLYNMGSTQFNDWSAYDAGQAVTSGNPLTSSTSNKFMQFKANFYSNQSGNSPRLTYGSLSNPLSECTDLNAPNTVYTLANNVSSTGTCFNVLANNITIDCNGYAINYSYAGILGYGVYSNGYNFTTIKNCVVKGGSGGSAIYYKNAIYFVRVNNGTILNNTISTSATLAYGIYLYTNSNSNTISNNTITTSNDQAYPIYLSTNSNTNSISNNIISSTYVSSNTIGIFVYSSNSNNFTYNNVTTTNANGLVISSSSFNAFTNNNFTTTAYKPVDIDGTTSAHFNNSIDSSNLGNGKPIFYNYSVSNLVYDRYSFENNYGQVIFAKCNNISVTNSNISNGGINLWMTTNSTISNNRINTTKNYDYGVYLYSGATGNNISNNVINTSGSYGYGVYLLTSANSNTISGNTINTSGAEGRAITLTSSSTNNISSNTITTLGSSGYAFYLVTGSTSNNITGNTIRTSGTSGHAFFITTSSANNLDSNNLTTSGLNGRGFHLESSSNLNISNTRIITSGTNGYGILFAGTLTNNTFSNMNLITNGSGAIGLISTDGSPSFLVTNSIINASNASVQEFYVSGTTGGTWNFTNVTRSNGAPINISWTAGANGTLNMRWYADIYTNYTNGTSASGINISSWNVNGVLANSTQTNSLGNARQVLLEYTRNGTSGATTTSYNNYTINASGLTYITRTTSINITNNKYITFTMSQDETPPILTLIEPRNMTYVLGAIPLNGTCEDETLFNRTTYSLDGGAETIFTFNTTVLAGQYEAYHNLIIRCYDGMGNKATEQRTFYLGLPSAQHTGVTISNIAFIWRIRNITSGLTKNVSWTDKAGNNNVIGCLKAGNITIGVCI